MSYICVVVVVVLHLLNGAYGAKSERDLPDEAPASTQSEDDKQLQDLLNKQIAAETVTLNNSGRFDNHFLPLNDVNIQLHHITIENYVGKMNIVECNLANQYLLLNVEWTDLTIKGSCTADSLFIAIYKAGDVEIIFNKPVAQAAINLAFGENNLKTSFVNLNFDSDPDSVNVQFKEPSAEASKNIASLGNSVGSFIKDDLERKLGQALQDQLDQLLSGISLQDIFSENPDAAAKYKATIDDTQKAFLQTGKLFVEKLRQIAIEEGLNVIPIPDQYIEEYSLVCNVKINLKKGVFRDTSTLQINGNSVGYKFKHGLYTITLNLRLDRIKIFYEIEDSTCGFLRIEGKAFSTVPSDSNNLKATIAMKFIKRGDNIFARASKILIVSVNVNNVDVYLELNSWYIKKLSELMKKGIIPKVKYGLESESPERAQPILDKMMPLEIPADELKDAIDQNLIEVEEE